jgi:hypothetical protein
MKIAHGDIELRPLPLPPCPWWRWPKPRQEWEHRHDYWVEIDGVRYWIKAGSLTDGLSIPVVLHRVMGHPFQIPSIWWGGWHDGVYRDNIVDDTGKKAVIPRATADASVFGFAACDGIPAWKARAFWLGVRAGGAWSYKARLSDGVGDDGQRD